jgi:hypothetical protein
MCVQVTKTANRFELSSLLEKILLKQVRWCLIFVGLYIIDLETGLLNLILIKLSLFYLQGKIMLITIMYILEIQTT